MLGGVGKCHELRRKWRRMLDGGMGKGKQGDEGVGFLPLTGQGDGWSGW